MGKPRIRSTETCPCCGLHYEKFRSDQVPDFQTAYDLVLRSSREAHANGDYSRNAYVGTVLGYMRLIKQGAWKEHIYWCWAEWDADHPQEPVSTNDEIPF